VGVALIGTCEGFLEGARKYSATPGLLSASLVILLGIGYILLAISITTWSITILGIALTIIKVALFFYPFATMYFFFEIKHGRIGGVGSLLILFFSTSHHFFAFSEEFYKTLPGAIFTIIAAMGYILQGFAMNAIFRETEPIRLKKEKSIKKPTEKPIKRFPIVRPY